MTIGETKRGFLVSGVLLIEYFNFFIDGLGISEEGEENSPVVGVVVVVVVFSVYVSEERGEDEEPRKRRK